MSCKYISLVNLIANKEIVPELFADRFSMENIQHELQLILPGQIIRDRMLCDYGQVRRALGHETAPDNAAKLMIKLLKQNKDT